MVDGLADIVEQACPFGDLDIGPQFSSHHTRQVADFQRMFEDILAVTGPEF